MPDNDALASATVRSIVLSGDTALGIEFGSTRIKACLVAANDPTRVLATGIHSWENRLENGFWTYSERAIEEGLQAAYADVAARLEKDHGAPLTHVGSIGVSAMMHGYIPLDREGRLLAPFRSWRNTTTGAAAAQLSELFQLNIPLRWSIAHLLQALLNNEAHLDELTAITSLAGFVHRKLTGVTSVGIGDASGMFPIDVETGTYDSALANRFDELAAGRLAPLRSLLPPVQAAGASGGTLTKNGAKLLDPSGRLTAGVPFCPPEGDASTGMVAANIVAAGTGNLSAGTSVFTMIVLAQPLTTRHPGIDVIVTPGGDPVAMVHSNNGAGEIAGWVGMFEQFAQLSGHPMSADSIFTLLFEEAGHAAPDAEGMLVYNHVAGEPLVDTAEGRPLFVRMPESDLSLANFARAQLYGIFATQAIGMEILRDAGVNAVRIVAHGGLFRTSGVAQRALATALGIPVAVTHSAPEGGAWGMAVLAAFARQDREPVLGEYLSRVVFAGVDETVVSPRDADVAGFAAYLARYRRGLDIQRAATAALT